MTGNSMKTRLLASTVFAGVAFMASASMLATAQEDDAAETVTAAEDETARQATVYVTGTRIAQPNLVTTSPVSTVTSQDIKLQGVTRVEDLVVQLPQAFAAQNSSVSNGATGTATVSLRNLGSDRTLVLIDGKRMPYGSPNDSAADLNLIPSQLVERVDVLTGGASAVYGSDALAGVVNFIMKKDFEGVQIDTQYGFYSHKNDGGTTGDLPAEIAFRATTNPSQFAVPDDFLGGYGKEISGVIGLASDDGRGNIAGYLTYRNNDAILQRDFDYSACSIGTTPNAARPQNGFTCGGSGTSFPGQFTDFATFALTLDPAAPGTFRPFVGSRDQYNFGPTNYYQRPDEKYSAGFLGNYQINDYVEAYANLMFMDYSSIAQIAPSGNFFSTSTINCDNPLLSASQAAAIGCSATEIASGASTDLYIGRRNVEGGGRRDNLGYQTYRGVIGLQGELVGAPAWNYDISAQYAQVTLNRAYTNEFLTSRLNRALDVVSDNGVPTCRSVVNGTDPNCVPYNVFRIDGVTPEALAYLQAPLVQTGTTTQNVVTATLAGDLGQYGWKLGSADEGLKVVGGVEYKRDALESITDVTFSSGDGAGQGGPTIGLSGDIDSYEAFGEFQLPLVTGKPGIELLDVSGAYRYATYSTGVSSDSWKIEGNYAPTEDLRLRASFNRAVRAPNVIELFAAQGAGLFDGYDPCAEDAAGGAPEATLARCTAFGVPAANYGNLLALQSPADQYNNLTGGNPDLLPEEGETITLGFVATPSFLPGLNLSVDYFDIKIENVISSLDENSILNQCYVLNNDALCAQVQRNGNGSLWTGSGRVEATNINLGGLETSGVDVNGAYGFEAGKLGGITLSINGTYVDKLVTDEGLAGVDPYDCIGQYASSCGTPNPQWRHRARMAWETPVENLSLNATWRYIGETDIFVAGAATDPAAVVARIDYEIEPVNYLDLAGTWGVKDWATLRFGVNNVLDKAPPLVAGGGASSNGNTYGQLYESNGRFAFVGVTLDF